MSGFPQGREHGDLMNARSLVRRMRTFNGAVLVLVASVAAAQALMPSASILQAEFLRRINAAEEVKGLFGLGTKVADFSSWRSVALLDDKSAIPLSPMSGADTEHVRLRVQVGRQLPLSADCPVVDALLSADGTMRVWNEKGWLEATYQRTARGWRIASMAYRAD